MWICIAVISFIVRSILSRLFLAFDFDQRTYYSSDKLNFRNKIIIIIIIINIIPAVSYLLIWVFLIFYWNVNNNRSLLVFKILINILADFSTSATWMASIFSLILCSQISFLNISVPCYDRYHLHSHFQQFFQFSYRIQIFGNFFFILWERQNSLMTSSFLLID